jgi:hypothetical protein
MRNSTAKTNGEIAGFREIVAGYANVAVQRRFDITRNCGASK